MSTSANSIYVFANLPYSNRVSLENYVNPLLIRIPESKRDLLKDRLSIPDSGHISCDSCFCRFRKACTCPKGYDPLRLVTSDRTNPSSNDLVGDHVFGHRSYMDKSAMKWSPYWDKVSVSEMASMDGVTLWIPLENGLYEWTTATDGYAGDRVRFCQGLGRIEWNDEKTEGRLFKSTR